MIRRSLARRTALTFLAAHMLVLLGGLMLLRFGMIEDADTSEVQQGPSMAAEAVANSIVRPLRGGSFVTLTWHIRDLQRNNPTLWFAARQHGKTVFFGTLPPEARKIFSAFPTGLVNAEFNLATPPPALRAAAVITTEDADHPTLIMAGGMDPAKISARDWAAYMLFSWGIWMAPFFTVLSIPAIIVATRIAMRGIRPVAREAAALDPVISSQRLTIDRTPRELLPLTRAVNAALDRLSGELERKRRFIADASHELRTPVAIMGMRIAALPPGEAKRDLERGQARLADMIGQMLDAERLAIRPPERQPVDLVDIARDAVADAAPLAIQAGYSMALTGVPGPVVAHGDRHVIGRAITNLVGNAVAHGGGEGLIDVHVGTDASIVVADQGPGIPVEARDRVFEAFHRERWDRDGCGLGLHLVREIMHGLGGKVSILDGPGCRVRLAFAPTPAAPGR